MCSMCGACVDASNTYLITVILGVESNVGGFSFHNLHWIDMLMLSSNTNFKKVPTKAPKPFYFFHDD
jgi:hypothetical protein